MVKICRRRETEVLGMDERWSGSEQVISADSVPVAPLHVRMRKFQGKMFVGGYEHVLELSDTATFIWRKVDGVRTVGEISQLVAREYEIPAEVAQADVLALFSELEQGEVLTIKGSH